MKICSSCGCPIDEADNYPENPAEVLGDIFHESGSPADDLELCPACKEELGILSIMGFDK